MRAVTFQSIVRTSSPGVYSRTAANSIPRPLNTAWYEPTMPDSSTLRVRIWMRRIFWKVSRSSIGLRHLHPLEHAVDQVLAGDVLRLGLVAEQDAVAQHVVGDLLHVLGDDVAAAVQERDGAGGLGEGERRARRRAERDQVSRL